MTTEITIETTITETQEIVTNIEETTNNSSVYIKEKINGWCYSDKDLRLLAKLIDCEAGDECSDEHKMWVGQVVLNRVSHKGFPDTIEDVIYQTIPAIQYVSAYEGLLEDNIPSERSILAAEKLLNGEVVCEQDVIWQSEFPQGEEVVKVFKTKYSKTYFCK